MSWTPAAHLARLKIRFPTWVIARNEGHSGLIATLRTTEEPQVLEALTIGEMETLLQQTEWGRYKR